MTYRHLDHDRLVAQLHGLGALSHEAAARRLGVSGPTVAALRVRHGLPAPGRRRQSAATRARIAEGRRRADRLRRLALADRLRDLGHLSHREAAALLDVHPDTVRRVRREFGLDSPGRRAA